MIPEATFFVHRIAECSDGWHARAISIDLVSYAVGGRRDDWPEKESWPVFETMTSTKLFIRSAMSDELYPIHPEQAVHVYADEQAIINAPDGQRIKLLLSQNATYLIIQGSCESFRLPFFITTGVPARPADYEVRVCFQISSIDCLPDVIEYNRLMNDSMQAGNRDDILYMNTSGKHPCQFPLNIYLPGILSVNDLESPCVYSVREWHNGQAARVLIHAADSSLIPVVGSKLIRRRRDPDGVVQQCTIAVFE